MNRIFQLTDRPDADFFYLRGDQNDVRLGEFAAAREEFYETANVVVLGCPQDEGVRRNKGRVGAAQAPDAIRKEFYKLTNFGISAKIFDLGNTKIQNTLEETHNLQTDIVSQILKDGKRLIILGGGNDLSYADGAAMAQTYGSENWIGLNIDAHFDVRAAGERNSGTPYRQLLEEKLIRPQYFYEVGFQPHFASPVYFRYLQNLGVNLISLDQLRSKNTADTQIRELIREKFIHHSATLNIFFGFDLDVVRASDAPGVSAPSPIGLRSSEFLTLVKFAASLVNTKIIEFTEVNPNFDVDDRTSKLVAIGMHNFISNLKF
ncbi:MAG: formimidoylglutamase [Pyrinomonadaceae bacterium]